jgi:dihydrodipicolinate synthase/N-acetylneuraminate lyase
MRKGFYPALGTPTDDDGRLIQKSFAREIELMTEAGAAGILCMGSMGNMPGLRDREYGRTASVCVNTVAKRVPVMVGVMDCSVNRVLDRIRALNNIPIEGVVATVPYYFKLDAGEIINFYTMLAKSSKYPVFIYDLPIVTQSPITRDILIPLMKMPNIKGIKTANINIILDLFRNNSVRSDFSIFYSGLDSFDAAIRSGIKRNLDGMFTCTPYNSKKMYENIENGDDPGISNHLNNILILRNLFLEEELFPAYSYAMGLLGCQGNYHPDYSKPVSESHKGKIHECMKSINEI